jgi:hypothetical protein
MKLRAFAAAGARASLALACLPRGTRNTNGVVDQPLEEGELMLRTNLTRFVTLVVLLAGIVTTAALATADNSITIGPSTVPVSSNYRFAINVTCGPSAEATPCNGLLSIQTFAIKPYASIATKKWNVGALPFSVPAGTTAPVRHWLRAGALVQAKRTGRVSVLVTILRDGTAVGTRVLTLKLNRR